MTKKKSINKTRRALPGNSALSLTFFAHTEECTRRTEVKFKMREAL